MNNLFSLALVTTLLINVSYGRDCSQSAANSVSMLDFFERRPVDSVEAVSKSNVSKIIKMIKAKDAMSLGITPGQKAELLEDLKTFSGKYSYFLVKQRNQFYLAITNANSCAPFDPIKL